MKQQRFSIRKRLQSFVYAFNGIKILISEEHNARIHLLAATAAIAAGFYFGISPTEWIAIVFAIGLVIALEIVNSSIENMADFISPQKHHAIKRVKDLAAAAVLVAAMTAGIIGLIIFVPKLTALFTV